MAKSDRVRQQIKNLEKTYKGKETPESVKKIIDGLKEGATWQDIVDQESDD